MKVEVEMEEVMEELLKENEVWMLMDLEVEVEVEMTPRTVPLFLLTFCKFNVILLPSC